MSRLPTPPVLQRPRQLAGSYKLADGMMAGNFGLDVALGESEIDQGRMAARIVYADGNRRDGVGDLLEVSGIQLWRHRANPISLYDHGKQIQLPIGTCEDPETKAYRNEIDPLAKTAAAWCFFYGGKGLSGVQAAAEYDHALFCEQLFDMVVKRILRGGSIGYQNIKTLPLQADYQTGTPPGQHLLVTLMLEFSLVVLPANGDTVMKGFPTVDAYNEWEESVRRNLSRGYLVCGKALSPVLHKSLASCVPAETKTVSGYEGSKNGAGQLVSLGQIDLEAAEQLAKVEAQSSKLPHVQQGMMVCPVCQKRYYTEAKAAACCGASDITRLRGKSVPVPLANIPDTKIPPARFNPGVGAICGCDKKKLKALRGKYGREKYMGVDQEQTATDTRCTPAGKYRVGVKTLAYPNDPDGGARRLAAIKQTERKLDMMKRDFQSGDQSLTSKIAVTEQLLSDLNDATKPMKSLPFHFGKGWTAVARKSLGVKGYELRRVRRDRDGLEGWIVFNTVTGRPDSDEIYWNESDARRHLADALESERMGGGYDDPDPGRGVRRKSIQVKYRNKLVKGVPNVSMKFDTSGMSAEQQTAFCKAMAEAGFGKPKGLGGRWSDGEKTQLTSPMKAATFAFDMDPATANIPDAVGKAVAIAAQHGAKFLGSQKSTQPQGTKAMAQKNTKAAPPAKKKAMPGTDVDAMAADLAGADAVAVATDEMAGVEGDVLAAEEKMGAQVLRRLHEIHSALLEEGDEMLELLENEQVRGLLEGKLQDVADTITECEELFNGEGYGSLNGEIEDKSEDGVDEEEEPTDADGNLEQALPDDSDPDEEEPVEDAVAGMATKQLRAKYLKALRKHYGKKQPAAKTKALTEDGAVVIASDIESQTADVEEKTLEPWEKKAVGSAAGYLKAVGEMQDPFSDTHRKDAYFHHKTLEPIGSQMEDQTKVDAIGQGVEMATDGGGAVKEITSKPQHRAAMARMRENDELDDYDDDKWLRKGICPGCGNEPCTCAEAVPVDNATAKMCGRKVIGAASQFFKELSETPDFTDDHRLKSMGWHKDLSGMAEAEEVGADASDADAAMVAPPEGDVQTKGRTQPKFNIGDRVVVNGDAGRITNRAETSRGWEYFVEYESHPGIGDTVREELIQRKAIAVTAVDTKALKQSAQQDQQALEEAARKLDRLAKLFG